MKKAILLIIIIFALSLSLASAAITYGNSGGTQIKVSIINQNPDPVEPGREFELKFKVENWGTSTANDVVIELLPQYPFTMYPGESAVNNIGSVWGMQRDAGGVIVKYKLAVDKKATAGDQPIDLRYKTASSDWVTITDVFNITVGSFETLLDVSSVSTEPETIQRGSQGTVSITINNLAPESVRNLKVKLGLGTGVPFVPVDSTNEKILNELASGESTTVEFKLLADPASTDGIYKVPLTIDYFDSSGRNYSRNSTIGLIVGSRPDLLITVDQTQIYSSGSLGTVSIKFANKGLTKLKFLTVTMGDSDSFKVISSRSIYVGEIDSDDYQTADFKLYVNPTTAASAVLPLEIEYRDNNGKFYQTEYDLALPLYSSGELSKYGLAKGNGFGGLLLIAVVVVAGLLAYKFWWKKRKSK